MPRHGRHMFKFGKFARSRSPLARLDACDHRCDCARALPVPAGRMRPAGTHSSEGHRHQAIQID